MKPRYDLSSQPKTSTYWLNLCLGGLTVFYVIYMAWQSMQHMTCGQIGVDYCEYWSAGTVANSHGYAAIYDLKRLEAAQRLNLPVAPGSLPIPVLPFLYLPVFVLPFQLLARLSPEAGYWIWTAVNAGLLFLYLRFFLRQTRLRPASARLMICIFASLPVFMNLLTGQMELWLVVCVGEFMRAALAHKPYRAGLWLGGIVLKPQVLIIIGIVLLLQRAWRILAGAASTSIALGAISVFLVGPSGVVDMLRGWLFTANGSANIWVEGMMNWRMIGVQLSNLSKPWLAWAIAGAGILVTLVVLLYVWGKRSDPNSPSFPVAVAGILAGSAMLSWHAHIHMAMMLLPPIIYLYQRDVLPQKLLDYWIFVPSLLFVSMVFVPETLIALRLVSSAIEPLIYFIVGAGEFSASLYLFAWAARSSLQASGAAAQAGVELSSRL